jgi:histidine ammonia-lyase
MQENLIRSHAAGLGEPLDPVLCRAILFARLRSMVENKSAVRSVVPQMLATLLNAGIAPLIPRKGGVGASGDLVQLSHLGMLLLGEGEAYLDGRKVDAATALRHAQLEPWSPAMREGLAIINGTSAMTGIALHVCLRAQRLIAWCIAQSSIIAEVVGADHEFISAYLNESKQHPGQHAVAAHMRAFLATSRIDDAPARAKHGDARPLQEHYSIRCLPQILGPFVECLDFTERIVYHELNSANDNPMIDPLTGQPHHGGNFHGEYIAFAMDALKISIAKCSMLLERQLNFLLNDDVNKLLPPFLNLGRLGVDLGLQGAQFTATSAAATNQTLAFPMSIHSISCNKDNQDVVSMGTNAALLAIDVLDNAFDILGISMTAVSQAVEAAGIFNHVGGRSSGVLAAVREVAPVIRRDAQVVPAIRAVARLVRTIDP